jgi:hypothetical protein
MLCRNTARRPGLTGGGEDEKRRATPAIEPVIGGAPQAEPFAGYVPAWQLGQGFDLRQPIQPQQFAPLAGGQVRGLLQRTATHQRQQSQGQKDRLQGVKSRRQSVKGARVAQEPFGQKSRQRAKPPSNWYIIGGDALQWGAGQQPAGGQSTRASGRLVP